MNWRRSRARVALIAFGASFLLVTCGPSGMEMVGDAMMDAASALRDAGRDAAEAARDTGADALEDTGRALLDSAPDEDAAAQSFCGTCTTTAVRNVSASEDPAQHVGGTVRTAAGHGIEIATGPLFVTDVQPWAQAFATSIESAVVLFTVPDTAFCDTTSVFSGGIFVSTLPPGVEVVTIRSSRTPVTGGRLYVASGRRLCTEGVDNISGGSSTFQTSFAWAGFQPYD